jgi:transcriptional regulator with XRE-family HTH domain
MRRSIVMRRLGMAKRSKPTTDALEILHRRFYEGKPERLKDLEELRVNDEIGRKIYELRTAAGLTQAQLGRMIGTTASVICRLEDADYEGHSLAMLRRIGAALGKRVEIRFVPVGRAGKASDLRRDPFLPVVGRACFNEAASVGSRKMVCCLRCDSDIERTFNRARTAGTEHSISRKSLCVQYRCKISLTTSLGSFMIGSDEKAGPTIALVSPVILGPVGANEHLQSTTGPGRRRMALRRLPRPPRPWINGIPSNWRLRRQSNLAFPPSLPRRQRDTF